jgi:dihydrolipoamide dehydrogenase
MVMGDMQLETELLIIGSGPGGYGAAFRAADLGMEVTVVDSGTSPGGTSLHQGCIPSKTFLFLTGLIHDARRAEKTGIHFGQPRIDVNAVQAWKEKITDDLSSTLDTLFEQRNIELLKGHARFIDSKSVRVQGGAISKITFQHAIIAVGSRPSSFPLVDFNSSDRIVSPARALQLRDIPQKLLVIGGGTTGLELASIYSTFGSRVGLVEKEKTLLQQVDHDLVEPLCKRLTEEFDFLSTNTTATAVNTHDKKVLVELETEGRKKEEKFDKVILATGRIPNSDRLDLENTEIDLDPAGFIKTDDTLRTSDGNIYAAGDITGSPMLAHKATRQGKIAAEVIAGHPSAYDVRAVPAVIYTDPQIGWCGLTEVDARKNAIPCRIRKFPWKYSDRAQTMGMTDGLTKLLTDPDSGIILGMGIVGRQVESLIAEAVLAIEMGALAEDLALTLHPHPSLSETGEEAAELISGAATHYLPDTQI